MTCCYAIYPDADPRPAAVFADLEDAIEWGVERYGDNQFRIAYLPMVRVEKAEQHGAAGPV